MLYTNKHPFGVVQDVANVIPFHCMNQLEKEKKKRRVEYTKKKMKTKNQKFKKKKRRWEIIKYVNIVITLKYIFNCTQVQCAPYVGEKLNECFYFNIFMSRRRRTNESGSIIVHMFGLCPLPDFHILFIPSIFIHKQLEQYCI